MAKSKHNKENQTFTSKNTDLATAIAQLSQAVKSEPAANALFKQHLGCSTVLKENLLSDRSEHAVLQLLAFASDLVSNYSPLRTETPEFSNPADSSQDFLETLPVQIRKVSRMNEQMLSAIQQSKVLLTSPLPTLESPSESRPATCEPAEKQHKAKLRPKLSDQPQTRWYMGRSSDLALPPRRKEDGWTPREMFKSNEL